jgi:2-amino-4-hydroxy-6-hydroxymethyldihydropteridine diphosphokinase
VRAFVLQPWLAVDPDATLTVAGTPQRVVALLDAVALEERAGVRLTDLVLTIRDGT